MIFIDPDAEMNMHLYGRLIRNGFRRSGGFVYTPKCSKCQECIPVRIPVSDFQHSKVQRRIWNRGKHLTVTERAPCFSDEHFRLYQHYLSSRHAGGGMDNPTPEQYVSFLTADWADTAFIEFRDHERLIAVAIVDYLDDGLSAVYTYFDPDYARFSPGKLAILWQIHETRNKEKDYLYLGYWIRHCNKMQYKTDFSPLQAFRNGHWHILNPD